MLSEQAYNRPIAFGALLTLIMAGACTESSSASFRWRQNRSENAAPSHRSVTGQLVTSPSASHAPLPRRIRRQESPGGFWIRPGPADPAAPPLTVSCLGFLPTSPAGGVQGQGQRRPRRSLRGRGAFPGRPARNGRLAPNRASRPGRWPGRPECRNAQEGNTSRGS